MKNALLAGLLAIAATPALVSVAADAQPYPNDNRGRSDYGRSDYGRSDDGRRDYGRPDDGRRDYGRSDGRSDYRWNGDRPNWDPAGSYRDDRRYRGRERPLGRDDRVYHGRDGRYYCKRNDGTTGLVIGGLGGGVAGGLIGGNTLGALVGAGAGALLGRSVDRGNVRCR